MTRPDRSNGAGVLAAEKWICANPDQWATRHAEGQARRSYIRLKKLAGLLRRRHRIGGRNEA